MNSARVVLNYSFSTSNSIEFLLISFFLCTSQMIIILSKSYIYTWPMLDFLITMHGSFPFGVQIWSDTKCILYENKRKNNTVAKCCDQCTWFELIIQVMSFANNNNTQHCNFKHTYMTFSYNSIVNLLAMLL